MGNTLSFSASHAVDPLLNGDVFSRHRRGAEVVSVVPNAPGPVVPQGYLLTEMRVVRTCGGAIQSWLSCALGLFCCRATDSL